MTLLTTEGFETRASKKGWALTMNSYNAGRFGGTSGGIGSGGFSLPTPTDVVIVGCALKVPTSGTSALFDFFDAGSANPQCRIQLRGDRYLEVHRGTNNLLTTSSGPVASAGEWIYIETKARCNDATGFVQVLINGVEVASYIGDTVATAGAGAGAGITMVTFGFPGNSGSTDDIYVCDTAGVGPYNDFLGEVQVETLVPNGNGTYSQLVGSDGNSVDNYLLVDELPASAADYAGSATVGHRDTYTFTDPTAGVGEILAVMPCAAVTKSAAGSAPVKIVERLASGVERLSVAMETTNLSWRNEAPKTTDPSGAAWTLSSVASTEFGVEVA
jgi:hypothetical protein